MNYKNGVASMVLVAALGSGACAGRVGNGSTSRGSYDNVYELSNEAMDMILNSAVKVEREYEFEVVIGETKTIGTAKGSGSGVAIFDDESKKTYILTAGHLVPTKEEICLSTGFFTQECYKVLKKKMIVEGHTAEVVKHNETFDLALIKLSGKYLGHHFAGKLAESMEVGNKIVGAGYPSGEWKSLRSGYVLGEDVGEGLEDIAGREPEAKKELIRIKDLHDIFEVPSYVVLDMSITPGDSGSGLYVLKDGVPELASIVQVIYNYKEGQKGVVSTKVLRGFVYGTDIADELGVDKR